MIRMGVIGYGYWGPNIVRNLQSQENMRVVAVSDKNPNALKRVSKAYPDIRLTQNAREVITATDIDALAIVTPVSTHYDLAREALVGGKHVFVEKPFTASSAQAKDLIDLATQKGLTIMVDHTFLFTGAVRKIKQLIDEKVLGDLYYYDSTRVNLGLFQHDANVIWDLAPHDFSIMDYLLPEKPRAISATGACHLNGHEDIAYITAFFDNNLIAHFNVNWLSPVKVRTTLLGGMHKMVVWNDVEADEKIKVYDKGVEIKSAEGVYQLLVSYRSGDMWAPKVEQTEALSLEAKYFAECVESGKTPFNGGEAGARVVRMLEAANESLKMKGALIYL
ncbi:MAG: oxidoreductase [Deltaproteobacteria bacterium CG_4_8_14_3_um_filter_51_11]|nr:Gfo/Idh/MocA family oxidoreductase [bacterium]OIP43246.1 MAG: oxidoreductase [Desulfobacteraceae bacterium CG2_30_51_40]PIX20664.1 MAG: oxidoreductase [Deltaproteobacteria bacterium CG_4_8_14_3_um_filter_51_11]PIY22480.1 MAG: oxidoreductase [Deltaproteobacteria bacterium CG_4_10_14_3_um_filter_51_14]PJB35239.1 MAG: oxidoreductase [Deltaproteobacteria bacterium CG_4_9_14_3_um_filter_51_14]